MTTWIALRRGRPAPNQPPPPGPSPPTLIGTRPTPANYVSLFEQSRAWLKLWNSFYMAATATGLSLLLCSLGGYVFAKLRFPGRGRDLLVNVMLATMVVPFAVLLTPPYVITQRRSLDRHALAAHCSRCGQRVRHLLHASVPAVDT
jgi:ABC-type glycerol-3-phosphate transport system permease component